MATKTIRPDFEYLKEKWSVRHAELQTQFWETHGPSLEWLNTKSKQLLLGSMTGLIMLSHPAVAPIFAEQLLPAPIDTTVVASPTHTKEQLIADLTPLLPGPTEPLNAEQEVAIGQKLSDYFHLQARAELDGKRLNRSYGIIGAEQHLTRYPGDTIATHFASDAERAYTSSGMAPGRGAWGYFAPSQEAMTQQDIDREKYYIAVQSFLSPGWNGNVNELYAFLNFERCSL